jgi:hypothetical protein
MRKNTCLNYLALRIYTFLFVQRRKNLRIAEFAPVSIMNIDTLIR